MAARPHLVVIMADQLRHDFIGALTPHISALMSESTVFSRAYCASPLCVPARGAFFTGRYPNETGCRINPWNPRERRYGEVETGTPNLYTLLEGTWDSWHTGKQHLYTVDHFDRQPASATRWLSLENGYDAFLHAQGVTAPGGDAYRAALPEIVEGSITRVRDYSIPMTGCYGPGLDCFFDGYIANQSLRAIRERDRRKPFLLNAMFLAPHPPLQIPEPYYSLIEEVELPQNVGRWSARQSPLQLYNLPGFFGSRYSRDDWREIWRVYAGLVALLDDAVGRIISELKQAGLYDDALILFTSDHGEMLGSHRLWQKMCMYEEATHVNLAVKLPAGMAQVAQSDALVSHVDVLTTLCDFLDISPPAALSGLSLRSVIEQGHALDREEIFIQFDGNGARGNFQRCLVRGRHKLIVDLFKDECFFELYDVLDDPQEQQNLAFAQPALVEALWSRLRRKMAQTGDELTLAEGAYAEFVRAYGPYLA